MNERGVAPSDPAVVAIGTCDWRDLPEEFREGDDDAADGRTAREGIDRHPILVRKNRGVGRPVDNRRRLKRLTAISGATHQHNAGVEGRVGRAFHIQVDAVVQIQSGNRIGGAEVGATGDLRHAGN